MGGAPCKEGNLRFSLISPFPKPSCNPDWRQVIGLSEYNAVSQGGRKRRIIPHRFSPRFVGVVSHNSKLKSTTDIFVAGNFMENVTKFFGIFDLRHAVFTSFALSIIRALFLLCILSSHKEMLVAGMEFEESPQVIFGTVALFGTPLSILACFGTLFRISVHVKIYSHYLAVQTGLDSMIFLMVICNGEACRCLVHSILILRGSTFVCVFLNTFMVFWGFAFLLVGGYIAYAVKCHAEELAEGDAADQLQYDTFVPKYYSAQGKLVVH